ncbi:unnamed protein product [Amoebophrya sp. A25]|nr:unnamed protein product [Amoebophrya sp. A25]|eukprot:GSA25T00015164001.1
MAMSTTGSGSAIPAGVDDSLGSSYKSLSKLHKREKVIVQYRLMKDYSDLLKNPLDGVDIWLNEENVYEWHVTISPLSGHYEGLRLHCVIMFPEDYPKMPPKVDLMNPLPHVCVFQGGFYFGPYSRKPIKSPYSLCTEMLQPPRGRYHGWSPSYSVTAVLSQLQCLLFDDTIELEDGLGIRNTLWDSYCGKRFSAARVCEELHKAQRLSDACYCPDCGYSGRDAPPLVAVTEMNKEKRKDEERGDSTAPTASSSQVSSGSTSSLECQARTQLAGLENKESIVEQESGGLAIGKHVLMKKATEQEGNSSIDEASPSEGEMIVESEEQDELNTVTLSWSVVSLPVSTSLQEDTNNRVAATSSAIPSKSASSDVGRTAQFYTTTADDHVVEGVDTDINRRGFQEDTKKRRLLPRVPGVLQHGDLVSFRFFGVPDNARKGVRNINQNLAIYNYGFHPERDWVYDIETGECVHVAEQKEDRLDRERRERLEEEQREKQLFVLGCDSILRRCGGEQRFELSGVLFEYGIVTRVDCHRMLVDVYFFGVDNQEELTEAVSPGSQGFVAWEKMKRRGARNKMQRRRHVTFSEDELRALQVLTGVPDLGRTFARSAGRKNNATSSRNEQPRPTILNLGLRPGARLEHHIYRALTVESEIECEGRKNANSSSSSTSGRDRFVAFHVAYQDQVRGKRESERCPPGVLHHPIKEIPNHKSQDEKEEAPRKRCVLFKNIPLSRVFLADFYDENVRPVWDCQPEEATAKGGNGRIAPRVRTRTGVPTVVKSYEEAKDRGLILMRTGEDGIVRPEKNVVKRDDNDVAPDAKSKGKVDEEYGEEKPSSSSGSAVESCGISAITTEKSENVVIAEDAITLSDLQTEKSSFVVLEDARSLRSLAAESLLSRVFAQSRSTQEAVGERGLMTESVASSGTGMTEVGGKFSDVEDVQELDIDVESDFSSALLLQNDAFDVWSLGNGDLISVSAKDVKSSASSVVSDAVLVPSQTGATSIAVQPSRMPQGQLRARGHNGASFSALLALQVDLAKSPQLVQALEALRTENRPLVGMKVRSVLDFGAFLQLPVVTVNTAVSGKIVDSSSTNQIKDESTSKGTEVKTSTKSNDHRQNLVIDGLLPFAPFMKRVLLDANATVDDSKKTDAANSWSCIGLENTVRQLRDCKQRLDACTRRGEALALTQEDLTFRIEHPVFVNAIDANRGRVSLSLLPTLRAADMVPGRPLAGIVVDASKEKTLGVFVAVSDKLVGLVRRADFGETAGNVSLDGYSDWLYRDRKTQRFAAGDRVKVWVVACKTGEQALVAGDHATSSSSTTGKQEQTATPAGETEQKNPRRPARDYRLDLTLDQHSPAMRDARWNYLVRPLRLPCAGEKEDGEATTKQRIEHVNLGLADQSNKDEALMREKAVDREVESSSSQSGSLGTAKHVAAGVYDYEQNLVSDRDLLLKNSNFMRSAIACYPDLFSAEELARLQIDYREQEMDLKKEGEIQRAAREKRLEAHRDAEVLRKMTPEERERILWGREYYRKIEEERKRREKLWEELVERIEKRRSNYPGKSVVDIAALQKVLHTIKLKNYNCRSCFVTGLSFKQDVLGVGLEIRPEDAFSDRLALHCSFDLLSKTAYYDFGTRMGVWGDGLSFWMPAAIDAEHFERALQYLRDLFQHLGNSEVAAKTRSYGTQSGSSRFHAGAQMREAIRSGGKITSLDEYRKQQAERTKQQKALERGAADKEAVVVVSAADADPDAASMRGDDATSVASSSFVLVQGGCSAEVAKGMAFSPASSSRSEKLRDGPPPPKQPAIRAPPALTENDMSYALEVLPKLMNSQVVFLLKGELHHSEKALEGYIGFHHLFLSILDRFPRLQQQVEARIQVFKNVEAARSKKGTPNIGEFLCLLSVSEKFTWDDLSSEILRETLDRNASWAIDPYPQLAVSCDPTFRLEKTFLGSIVSIRLLVFNVWFLRNVVFRYETTEELLEARRERLSFPKLRLRAYNRSKGVPSAAVLERLTRFFRAFREGGGGLESWAEYFQYLNLAPVSKEELDRLLLDRIVESVRKGYLPKFRLRQAEARQEMLRNRKANKKAVKAGAGEATGENYMNDV